MALINKINEHKVFNFGIINKKFILQSKQISELKQSVDTDDDALSFVGNNKKLTDSISNTMKNKIDFKKEEYSKLTPEEKQEYLKKIKFNRYETDNKINELFKQRPSVEARLTVMSLAKQEQILEFIKELDTNIQQLEDYTTPYEVEVNELILENLLDESILEIQKRYIEEQTEDIFKLIKSDSRLSEIIQKATDRAMKAKEKLDSVKRYQAFYTPAPVVKKMLDMSKSLKGYNNQLHILEPTAGVGNIVVEILKLNKEHKIYMVEIEPKSRDILSELVATAPDVLTLYEQGDFLKFEAPTAYDLIVMNPPFHLRKANLSFLDRDYYDIDFVKRAYYMLKDGGELIALVKSENANKAEYSKWLNEHNAEVIEFEYKDWEASKEIGKDSCIKKINLSIIALYRNNEIDTREENKDLKMEVSLKTKAIANDAKLYNMNIENVKQITNSILGSEHGNYLNELELLKSHNNLNLYDVKQFLNKFKSNEYKNNIDYLHKFIRNNKIIII